MTAGPAGPVEVFFELVKEEIGDEGDEPTLRPVEIKKKKQEYKILSVDEFEKTFGSNLDEIQKEDDLDLDEEDGEVDYPEDYSEYIDEDDTVDDSTIGEKAQDRATTEEKQNFTEEYAAEFYFDFDKRYAEYKTDETFKEDKLD